MKDATLKKVVDAHMNDAAQTHAEYFVDDDGEIRPAPNGEGHIYIIGGENVGYCICIRTDDVDCYCYPSLTLEGAMKNISDIQIRGMCN